MTKKNVHISVVYHSVLGHTKKQALAIAEGALNVSHVKASLFNVDEFTFTEMALESTDAIVFGSPTFMGSVSAPFKTFMDASSKIWLKQKWKDKLAAGFTSSTCLAGDKLTTLIQMSVFAAQHGMIWVGQTNIYMPGQSDELNRMGTFLGAVAQASNHQTVDLMVEGDLKTAEKLGIRVAQIAKKMR